VGRRVERLDARDVEVDASVQQLRDGSPGLLGRRAPEGDVQPLRLVQLVRRVGDDGHRDRAVGELRLESLHEPVRQDRPPRPAADDDDVSSHGVLREGVDSRRG
jgi:hypothetical protein